LTYTYSGGANNGQIAKTTNAVNGETITYQYDSLRRLVNASSTMGRSSGYSYDGFGNLTDMTGAGGAPAFSTGPADWATNRITPSGVSYDGNGNINALPNTTLGYDVANRLVSVSGSSGSDTIFLYDEAGEKLGGYSLSYVSANNTLSLTAQFVNVYFAGRLISKGGSGSGVGGGIALDRLGSVGSAYYPFGVEYSATANDTEKYATYTRDSLTGLDYAMNRYYSSIWGRFVSPDPSSPGNGMADPQNWNRYAYVSGDPVNKTDPWGLCSPQDDPPCYSVTGTDAALGREWEGDPTGQNWMDLALLFGPLSGPVHQPPSPLDPPRPGFLTGRQLIMGAERLALKWLNDEDCAKLFDASGSGFDPVQVLSSLVNSGQYTQPKAGVIRLYSFQFVWSGLGGITTPNISLDAYRGADIFINTTVDRSLDSATQIENTAATLIEELGHAYYYTDGSGGSAIVPDGVWNYSDTYTVDGQTLSANNYNSYIVLTNCDK
jgi:RHS repeat-associated protein